MMARRSTGKTRMARALWYVKKGTAELRSARCRRPGRAMPASAACLAASAAARNGWFYWAPLAQANGSACGHRCRRAPFRSRSNMATPRPASSKPGQPISLAGRSSRCIRTRTTSMSPLDALAPIPEALPARRAPWPPTWKPPSMPSGTAAPVRGSHRDRRGRRRWAVAGGTRGRACPAPTVTAVDVEEQRRALAEALGVGFARPGARTHRCRRRVPCQRHRRRPRCRHPLCRPRGAHR